MLGTRSRTGAAAAIALSMTLAGIGGLAGTAEAGKHHHHRRSKHASSSQKASSKASQKNSIDQSNNQSNQNSTKQVAGDGGDGGDGGHTTCISAANGNAAAVGGLFGGVIPLFGSPASGNQACSSGDGGDGGAGGSNQNGTVQVNDATNSADHSQNGNDASSVAANAAQSDG